MQGVPSQSRGRGCWIMPRRCFTTVFAERRGALADGREGSVSNVPVGVVFLGSQQAGLTRSLPGTSVNLGGPPAGSNCHSTLTISRPCAPGEARGEPVEAGRTQQCSGCGAPGFPRLQPELSAAVSPQPPCPRVPSHLHVALPVVDEALGEHLVDAGVAPVGVLRLGVAIVHLEHAAEVGEGGQGGRVMSRRAGRRRFGQGTGRDSGNAPVNRLLNMHRQAMWEASRGAGGVASPGPHRG